MPKCLTVCSLRLSAIMISQRRNYICLFIITLTSDFKANLPAAHNISCSTVHTCPKFCSTSRVTTIHFRQRWRCRSRCMQPFSLTFFCPKEAANERKRSVIWYLYNKQIDTFDVRISLACLSPSSQISHALQWPFFVFIRPVSIMVL